MHPPDLIWHAHLDSTNAEALRQLDREPLHHGWAVATQTQTAGRGQRGRLWTDTPGENLLLSVVVTPAATLEQQPLFSFAIAMAVAEALEQLHAALDVSLKWPNDLYVNGRKAGGILIENVLRGTHWQHAVVGVGINLNQTVLPPHLPGATSLALETGAQFSLRLTATAVRDAVADAARTPPTPALLARYNERLYRRGLPQAFRTGDRLWTGLVANAEADGRLRVISETGHPVWCVHGVDDWVPLYS